MRAAERHHVPSVDAKSPQRRTFTTAAKICCCTLPHAGDTFGSETIRCWPAVHSAVVGSGSGIEKSRGPTYGVADGSAAMALSKEDLRLMKRFCTMAVLGLVTAGSTAMAGPNAGGLLLVHTDDTVIFSTDTPTYIGQSTMACDPDFDCPPQDHDPDCLITFPDPTSGKPDTENAVWWVLAAFPEGSCPSLAGLTFGATWPNENDIIISAFGHGGDFELPTSNWPFFLGSGTAVTWGLVEGQATGRVTEVYWFAGYAYYGPAIFTLGPHPTQDGNFADAAVPSNIDPITGYGALGLRGATGTNPDFMPTPTIESSWGDIKAIFGNE